MQLEAPVLNFPAAFCCNCGDINCVNEIQDTRVTRVLGIADKDTTFQLSIPTCPACRKTLKRHPSGWLWRALVWLLTAVGLCGLLYLLRWSVMLPAWLDDNLLAVSAVVALLPVIIFYRLRRPKPPQTSFYQPVRIKAANVLFGEAGGQVAFLKLAFTNHEYFNVFSTANRDLIQARRLAVIKA